ncbi:MAG: APC family permease [Marinomonas sp.]
MSDIQNSAASAANKKIGFVTMMAICVGLVIAQGVMISALQGIGIGGMAFIFAMIIALILAQFNAMSFAELSLMFPQEGTLATYTQKAIGHFPAIVSVFAGYVVVALLAIPVEMFLVDAILGELFPGLLPEKVAPLLILGLFTITNLIGTDVFAKVQNLLAFVLVTALIITGATAITSGLQSPQTFAGTPVDWSFDGVLNGSVIGLVGLALWTMVGVEFICPLINDVKNPNKNIPRAMHLSLFIIFTIFVAFAYGASLLMDVESIMGSPLPFIDYANAVFGKSGLIIAAVMAVTATCSTMNTILSAVPKMLHGMAENKQAFPQLKITNKHNVPWVGTLMMAVGIMIPFFIFGIDALIPLIIAATTSWLLAYCVAHIDVIVLRKRLPNQERPYKTPFYPVPQILGIAGMLYVAANNSPAPEMTQLVYTIAGSILLVLSVIGALWVKLYMKRGLFEPDMS